MFLEVKSIELGLGIAVRGRELSRINPIFLALMRMMVPLAEIRALQ